MRTVFKNDVRSYLLTAVFGVLAGMLVVLFCELPGGSLWAFYYWSSRTYGFWMFSASLIVLYSEKRLTAGINAAIYIFLMFLETTIYMSLRIYRLGVTPFRTFAEAALDSIPGWLGYSVPPAVLCGVLGAVLWSGRGEGTLARVLRTLPAVFLFAETAVLAVFVITERTRLFSAVTDLALLIIYLKCVPIKERRQ